MFADGPVGGGLVLVHGVLGGVGAMAARLARWGGATVRHGADLARVGPAVGAGIRRRCR